MIYDHSVEGKIHYENIFDEQFFVLSENIIQRFCQHGGHHELNLELHMNVHLGHKFETIY